MVGYGIRPIPGDEIFTRERIRWCCSRTAYFKGWSSLDEDDILSIAMETVWRTHLSGVGDADLLRFAFRIMKGKIVDHARYLLAQKRSPLRRVPSCSGEDDDAIIDALDSGSPDPLHLVMSADLATKLREDLGRSCGRCNRAVTVLRKGLCHSCYKKDAYARTKQR